MIVDLLTSFLSTVLTPVLSLLPQDSLNLPSATGLAQALNGLDGLVPVLGVLRLGAAMLLALVAFLGFRVVVFLRHFLLP